MQFNYVVRTKEGETQSGVAEAANRQVAIEALQSRGFVILSLQPVSAMPVFARKIKFFQRVKGKELVAFSRQLSILFSAQVPLLESLRALARQTENEYFSQIIMEVADDVEGGTILSKALARHDRIFTTFFINMVRSGEASGSLESALLYLADYMEKQFYIMSKVKGAMYYPAFIMCAFFGIGVVLMIMVVPTLTSFLQEAGAGELPFTTQIVIGTANFLKNWWWLFFGIIFVGIGYFYYALRHSKEVKHWWDGVILKMPIFGKKILQKIYLTRFAENLSTLIQGGLTILQALQVSAEVSGNYVYESIILTAKEDVRIGNTLSSSLARHELIPPLMIQMIATGEKTGSMDTILKKMASFYSKEVDATVDTLSQLIEPVLIIFIGAAVGILVSAILMPIYNIAGTL